LGETAKLRYVTLLNCFRGKMKKMARAGNGDPALWRSNSFASLRPRLIVWMRSVVA